MDLSKNALEAMKPYEDLLCPDCRMTLQEMATPIADRLNKGGKPRIRDMMKLLDVLCPVCLNKVTRYYYVGNRH